MNIGLLDIDRGNFPNLALMKLSAWHKSQGDNVEFVDMFGQYDIIYKSKVFSWTQDDETAFNCDWYVSGGTGYGFNHNLDENIDSMMPDYSLYHCDHAYGFLTRGCPNKCSWCIVPQKEGDIRAYADIDDFIGDHKSAILMDNNVLASEHGIKQIEKIVCQGIKIDFNQGLDSRLVDNGIARLLIKVKWIRFIRFACDSQAAKKPIESAIKLLRNNGYKGEIFCYVLVKDIDEGLDRIEFLRSLNVDPYAQAYRDFKNTEPTRIQKDLCRWTNRKAIFKSIPWNQYWSNR